jgi:hypothetical protein
MPGVKHASSPKKNWFPKIKFEDDDKIQCERLSLKPTCKYAR